jgi:hypothetical protein
LKQFPADVKVEDIDASGTPSGSTFLRGDGAWQSAGGGGGGGGAVDSVNGQTGDVTLTAADVGAATDTPQFVTLAATGDLDNERVLTAGTQVTLTDAGAGNAVTFDWQHDPLTLARFWMDGANSGDFAILNSGTGASGTLNIASASANHVGIAQNSTGSTSSGRSAHCYIEATSIQFGTYPWRSTGVFRIPTLSDGTNTFTVVIGFTDTFTSGAATDGAYFRYTHGTNSGKYECVTRSNSSETANDSGVTATAGVWHSYRIIVNAAATQVLFYIDGTLVATHTTNIPSGSSRVVGYGHNIIKSLGATARTLLTDCCLVEGRVSR